MSADGQNEYSRQRRHELHTQNLRAGEQDDTAAEVLRYLSEIDDLPIDRGDPVMGQLISKLSSTANLSAEQITSNEWVREYLLLLYLAQYPRKDGVHGAWRAWSHDDREADLEPLSPEKRMQVETFVTTSKLALTRSEDFKAVEESTRNVSESVVHNEDEAEKSGGILGRLK